MDEEWGINDPVVGENDSETWGENDLVVEDQQDDWGANDSVIGESANAPSTPSILQQYDEVAKGYKERSVALQSASEKYKSLAESPERTPEQEVEMTNQWQSMIRSQAQLGDDASKLKDLQPAYDKYFADQKQARIDYIEDRRGSGIFGDEGANALYELDGRAEQEYEAARAIEDDQKRKEAMASIQAKYSAEEKSLNNQFVDRFKEGETKINNAADVIGQAAEKGMDVGTYLIEYLGSPEEYRELQESVLNQNDPEKGKLYREALTMLDLARGQKVKEGPADTWKLGTEDGTGRTEAAKVGIVNNEIRVSPLHVWDAEGIKAEINALDISDAKKQKTIASIPQLQEEAAKVELPFLQQVSEFNDFVKENNLENVSPKQQISQWKNRNEDWLDYVGKTFPQIGIGLTKGALGLLEAGQAIVGGTALTLGAQDFADPFLDSATKTSDEIQRLSRISQEIGGPTFAAELAAVVPQIVTQIGFGSAIGLGGSKLGLKPKTVSNIGFGSSVGMAFAQSYGGVLSSAFQQLEKEKIDGGMDPVQARAEAVKEAQLPAALSGLSTAIVTTLGGKRGAEGVFREGVDGIKAKLNTAAFKGELDAFVPNIFKGMRNEGYEEFADQLAQGIIEQFSFNPELATSDIVNNAFKALVIGGITGGTVEGLKYGYDYMRAPSQMARREESMASMRQSISDVEKEISEAAASSPIGAEFQREYDVTQPSDMATNLGARSVDRNRMTTLQEERKQLTELLEDDGISRVARNQLEAKLAAADFSYYNEILVPSRINVVNEQIVDQLDALGATQQTKDSVTALAKIANGLGAESLTGRERVAVGITSVGEGRFLPSKKNPMVEINEQGVATVTEAGRLMAENVGMVPLVRMIGLSETTQAKAAEIQRIAEEIAAQRAQTEAKETAESEEAKRYGPASAEALKQQAEGQPPAGDGNTQAKIAQLLKEQEEAQRQALEALQKKETGAGIEEGFKQMGAGIVDSYYEAVLKSLQEKGEVPSPEKNSSVGKAWDRVKGKMEPEEFVKQLRINSDDPSRIVVPETGVAAVTPPAVGEVTPPTEPAQPEARPTIDPETLNPRGKQAVKILTSIGVDEETAALVASSYQDEAGEMGAEEWRDFVRAKFEENGGVIPAQMRYSEDPEYYQLAFNVAPEEAAQMVESAKAENQRMAQDELQQNKQWRRKDEQATQPQRGIAQAQPEAKAVPVAAGEVPPSPAIEGRGVPATAPKTAQVALPPAAPPAEPPVAAAPAQAPLAGALTEEQAQNFVKAAERERARKPPVDVKGKTKYGVNSVAPKVVIGKSARAALINVSRLNLSKIAQSDPNEIMMQDVAAILAELQMPILDSEEVVSLSSLGRKGRAGRFTLSDGRRVIAIPSTLKTPVELFVHEVGHTITADEIRKYAPRRFTQNRGRDYLDTLNKAINDTNTPEPIRKLFSLYISTIDQLGITEQYFGADGVAGSPKADTSRAMARRLQAQGTLRKDLNWVQLYGLANIEEFVSQTFAEPDFRELLKTLKDPTQPSRTLWTAFVEAIQKILQLPKGSMAAGVIEASVDIGMYTVPAKKAGVAAPSPATTAEADMAPEPENSLGYDITNVVEDIKQGKTDGPLKAVNAVVKQSTELRDRIKRESQKRQRPRVRGQAPIIERIARERSSGKISDETAKALTDFVNTIRPDAIGDTAISIRGAGNVSNFDFGDSLVSFYLTQDKPELGARVGIHEFWHGLSRFLPKEELGKMSKDYTGALSEYINENPWFLAFVGRYSLTPEQYEDYKIFNPKEAETKLAPVIDSQGNITKYQIIYDNESYRYIMLDEWIAENMTDLVREKQAAPDTFMGKLAKIFWEFLDMIQAKLGLDAYESFYQLVTDPKKKLQLYRIDSVARPFQIYQPQTYAYSEESANLIRYNSLAPEPEVREATKKHIDAAASNNVEEAQRLTDEVAKSRNYNSENLLFHGTTHIFNVFKKDRANIENDFGKGYYLTNTEADAQTNYAGEGPDLTNRIERLAEQLQSNEDMDEDVAKEKAREILSGGGQRIMRVYVRLENPFNVGGPNETFLDYEAPYDETNEEYGEPTGTLVDFLDQLRSIIERYSEDSAVDADKAVGNILEAAFDQGGINASDLVSILKQEDSGIMWASDENGDLASSEIIREAIEAAGFDGIVDNLVNQKFGSQKRIGKAMAGMGADTVHTIVFNSSQIKSADAITRDDQDNVIPLSERFLAEEEDVRYAPEEEFEISPEQVEDQIDGTPEASTIKVMGAAFKLANEQSAAEGSTEGTLPLETITNAWMNSGRDTQTLEDAIIRYTNLSPEVATTLAEAISKQLDIQRGIAEISDMASKKRAEDEIEERAYSFARRVKEDLPPSVARKIETVYEVLRNDVSVQEANEVMRGLSLDEAIAATKDMENGVSMPVRSMMAQIVNRRLMDYRKNTKKSGRNEDYKASVEAHVDFFNWTNEYFKELGQGVQAISRFMDLGADGILRKLKKDTDKAVAKKIKERKSKIDQIKKDIEDGDNAAFNAAVNANKSSIDQAANNAAKQEAKKLTIEEQAQKLAQKAAKKVTGEAVRPRKADPLSELVNGHLRKYNKDFLADARAMGISQETAQKIDESAQKLRDSRVATKSEKERFDAMQEERMRVKRQLARENKYIYGERPTIWENYQSMFSDRLARRLMRDPQKKVPPSLLLFTDRLTENLLGFIPESERQASTPKSFQAMVEDALNNKEKYQEAFNKALRDISAKVEELETEASETEEGNAAYFQALAAEEFLQKLAPKIQDFPVSEKLVSRFVGQKTKNLGISLIAEYNRWYRSSRRDRGEIDAKLQQRLIADLNIPLADARRLSQSIIKDFREKADARRQKALERFKKPQEKSDPIKETPLKKFFELTNMGALTDQDAYEIMANRFDLPTWDQKFADKIYEMAQDIQDMDDGLQRRLMTQNLMVEIARQKGFNLADLGSGFIYANILSSPDTHMVNIVDTLINNFANAFADAVSIKDFSRLRGVVNGYRKGIFEAVEVMKTGRRINMPSFEEKAPLIAELVRFGKKGGVKLASKEGANSVAQSILESKPAKFLNAAKWVGRLLEAQDALNFSASVEGQRYAEAARIATEEGLKGRSKQKRIHEILNVGDGAYQKALQQAEAEGYMGTEAKFRAIEIQDEKIPADIKDRSFERGLRDVYRNMPVGVAGQLAATVNSAFEKIDNPWVRNALKLTVSPFIITPVNLFNKWLDWSPWGYKRLFMGTGGWYGVDSKYYVAPYAKGTPEWRAQLFKANSSVMVMGLLGGLIKAGIMTLNGRGPSDEEERKQWSDDGNKPYTFRFGNGPQISFVYSPWAVPLSVMANMVNWNKYNAKDDASYAYRLMASVSFVPAIVMELPFFQGAADLIDLFNMKSNTDMVKRFEKFAEGKTGMLFPNFLRYIDRLFDPQQYDSQGVKGIIIDQMPFARRLGGPKMNMFGEPIGEGKPLLDRLAGRFVAFPKPSRESRILAKYDAYPYMPNPRRAEALIDGEKAPMTEEQYGEFAIGVGQEFKKWLNSNYDPDAEVSEQALERGKKRISKRLSEIRARWVRKVSTY
jgi:hypothetical protein